MYNCNKHIHFVGIGGIGMSGIALILKEIGYTVSGCDCDSEQQSILLVKKAGCRVHEGNNSKKCFDPSIDVMVYSSAIAHNSAEIMHARKRGIPVLHRSHMLAELMRTKNSIAVAGSHGKTTTSSMIGHVLYASEYDPTILVGGHVHSIKSNARYGKSAWLVAEADESDRSFLSFNPAIEVVTNVDLEHLDTYKDLNDIKKTFVSFMQRVPFYGKIIACIDDPNLRNIITHAPQELANKILTYGHSPNAHYHIVDPIYETSFSKAVIQCNDNSATHVLGEFVCPMPGPHNLLNATAAITCAHHIGIPTETIATSLASFQGVDRRFTFKGTYKGAEVFDDYGHHPVEIQHVIDLARKRAKNRLIVLFQPHRFTRTKKLWSDFIKVLSSQNIDHLFITDIFPASESPLPGITSKRLAHALQKTSSQTITYIHEDEHFSNLEHALEKHVVANDLVLFLGAGKINKLAQALTKKDKNR